MVVPYSVSNTAGINFSQTFTPPVAGSYNTGQLAPLALGQTADGTDGSKWVYCLAGVGGVTGLGYVVVMDEAFGAVMMSNSVGGLGDKIGVAPTSAAAGDYIWIQVYGTCDDIRVSASCAANVPLASTVTAGEIDDAVATPTKNLTGIILTTARAASAGNAPGLLNYPVVGTTN
jgi:hypothetical protein